MTFDLNAPITDFSTTTRGYLLRDGYVFTAWNDQPKQYNVIVIREPLGVVGHTQRFPQSEHTLDEHIRLINELHIERSTIIANDLSFVAECPSLKYLSVYPPHTAKDNYDYSPLYYLPEVKSLSCQTVYGDKEQLSCFIDYSKVNGLIDVGVYGKGHLNFASVPTLEALWVSNRKDISNLYETSCSQRLKKLSLVQCGIKSLCGIENFRQLQYLSLYGNRSLHDAAQLCTVSQSLRLLSIENCPKITDFSFLNSLTKLEHLTLRGSNTLPNLHFLERMEKLQTLTFSMEIADGNLTPCLRIPYAYCAKGKSWYNLKDRDLPKETSNEPFKIC